mmetsp:Transcript_18036/g.42263  ORF Transcript_18036/g.42263 Transcript_18036/m.42263 type:complete len:180 (-) Transcript_18036:84-623(-)
MGPIAVVACVRRGKSHQATPTPEQCVVRLACLALGRKSLETLLARLVSQESSRMVPAFVNRARTESSRPLQERPVVIFVKQAVLPASMQHIVAFALEAVTPRVATPHADLAIPELSRLPLAMHTVNCADQDSFLTDIALLARYVHQKQSARMQRKAVNLAVRFVILMQHVRSAVCHGQS